MTEVRIFLILLSVTFLDPKILGFPFFYENWPNLRSAQYEKVNLNTSWRIY